MRGVTMIDFNANFDMPQRLWANWRFQFGSADSVTHEAIKYCLPFLSVLFTNNSSVMLSVFIGPYVMMPFIDIWWSYKLPYWSSLAIATDIVILSFSSKKDETLCQKKKKHFKISKKQGRIHGYLSRVRVGRGSIWVTKALGQVQWGQRPQKHKKSKIGDRPTDQQTDQPTFQPTVQSTDRPTNRHSGV